MQNSSEFQYIAIDQIAESPTNPRKTFDPVKLEELANSIRENGVIQPVVIRPRESGFELVVGARRFRASQLAETFSIPAHVKELTDAQVIEWQLLENSQRVDVHPYQEAQGFQRLLDMPGYDVAAIAAKSGKSASHIYARLSLLQLIPTVAEAFEEDRITASHANLIARLPQEHQLPAFENCWRKDWKDSEAHLLPAKSLTAWIQANLYLNLADAPFDTADATLNEAGACLSCSKRSGYNTSLFADVQGDQCLDGACYQGKVVTFIDRAIADNPQLVQIETAWRPDKERRPGALRSAQVQELDGSFNPDAEPPCPHTRQAIVVFGKPLGALQTVCIEPDDWAVHNAQEDVEPEASEPPPALAPPPEGETEEEEATRIAAHDAELAAFEAERMQRQQERETAETARREAFEAEQQVREALRQERLQTFNRLLSRIPVALDAVQMRFFLRLLVERDAYDFLDAAASRLGEGEEANDLTDEEIVLGALDRTTDEHLARFALTVVLSDHVRIPREGETDWLAEAVTVFPEPVLETKKKPKKIAAVRAKTSTQSKRKAA